MIFYESQGDSDDTVFDSQYDSDLRNASAEISRELRVLYSRGWVQLEEYERQKVGFYFPPEYSILRRHGHGDMPPWRGTRIPRELFRLLLHHVRWLCPTGAKLAWRPGLPSYDDALFPLKACSLVCLHWANLCRPHIFSDARVKLTSPEAAELLLRYSTRGCPSLVPLLRFIATIDAEQSYASSSFCHILHHPWVTGKLDTLKLIGPIPDDFPRVLRLDSPHWSVPSSVVMPPSLLPYRTVEIHNIRLPSFAHVCKYTRDISRANLQSFRHWTWGHGAAGPHCPLLPRRIHPRNKLERKTIPFEISADGCTDNAGLCLVSALAHPGFALFMLGGDDYRRMRLWINARDWPFVFSDRAFYVVNSDLTALDPPLLVRTRFCALTRTYYKSGLDLFGVVRRIPETGILRMELVGVRVNLDDRGVDEAFDLPSLVTRLEGFETLRVVVLQFTDFERLKTAVQPPGAHRPMALPRHRGRQYVLVCSGSWSADGRHLSYAIRTFPGHDHERIRVNPVTLRPTGRYWTDEEAIVPSLLAMDFKL